MATLINKNIIDDGAFDNILDSYAELHHCNWQYLLQRLCTPIPLKNHRDRYHDPLRVIIMELF